MVKTVTKHDSKERVSTVLANNKKQADGGKRKKLKVNGVRDSSKQVRLSAGAHTVYHKLMDAVVK